jgi:hypothetical protein
VRRASVLGSRILDAGYCILAIGSCGKEIPNLNNQIRNKRIKTKKKNLAAWPEKKSTNTK